MGGPELEMLLVQGQASPLVGVVCKLLYSMKKYVDDFDESEVECRRLSVNPFQILNPKPYTPTPTPYTLNHEP